MFRRERSRRDDGRRAVLLALLVVSWVNAVAAHSDGAPPGTCDSMTPRHDSAVARTDPSPFQLSVSQDSVAGSERLTVTLSSTEDTTFRGFIVKAVSTETLSGSLGVWDSGNPNYKRLRCDDTQFAKEAATHTNATDLNSLDMTWIAPSFYSGSALLIATVVQDYDNFWTNVNASVKVTGVTTTSGPPTTTLPPVYDYTDCWQSRGCFGYPNGCVSAGNCFMLLKYSPSETTDGQFDFEIMSRLSPADGYVAMGFSDDQSMGGDVVVQCVVDGSDVNSYCSYNDGHENIITQKLTAGSGSSFVDGILSCSFSLPGVIPIDPLSLTYDIAEQSYYLMLVKGPADNAAIGTVAKHDNYTLSNDKVNVSDTSAPVISTTTAPSAQLNYSDCFTLRGCLGYPEGCAEIQDCSILVKYSPSTTVSDCFDFVLSAAYDGYVAMGFSIDTNMGNDAVTQCFSDGSTVKAFTSYNYGFDDGGGYGNTVIGPVDFTGEKVAALRGDPLIDGGHQVIQVVVNSVSEPIFRTKIGEISKQNKLFVKQNIETCAREQSLRRLGRLGGHSQRVDFSKNSSIFARGIDRLPANWEEIIKELDSSLFNDGSYVDGIVECSFSQPGAIQIQTNTTKVTYDIEDQSYFIILAVGPVDDPASGEIGHHTQKYISTDKVNVTDTSAPAAVTTIAPSPPAFDYSACGKTRGCFGYPEDCVGDQVCSILLQYSSSLSTEDEFDFVLTSSQEGYVAMAFSDDTNMGDDSVVQCLLDDTTVKAFSSYNIHGKHGNTVIGPLDGASGSYVGGIIQCAFSQPSIIEVDALNKTFYIGEEAYYLFLVYGPVVNASSGTISKHDAYVISDVEINISNATVPVAPTTTVGPAPPFDYSACGNTRGCFGYPDNCVGDEDCRILLQFSKSSSTVDEFDFILSSSQQGYVAMAFSDDTSMGDDAVVQCLVDSTIVKAFSSYNNHGQPDNTNTVIGSVVGASGSYVDGIIQCFFTQPSIIHIDDLGLTFDINTQAYYLMLAFGPVTDANSGEISKHADNPQVSNTKVKMSDITIVGSKGTDVKILIHGTFMVVAWVGTVAVAIFLARYYKDMWPDTFHLTTKIWFTYHRCLNVLTVLFSVVAFVLIFVYVGGFSDVWHTNPHPILGTIAFALMIMQPVGALLRPPPGTVHRPMFNWLHYLGGMLSWAFAIMTIFYAVSLPAAGLPEYTWWIIISYLAFVIIVFSVMEYSGQLWVSKPEPIELAELNAVDNNNQPPKAKPGLSAQASMFKKIMLVVFTVGVTGFTIGLIVVIVV